MPQLQLSPTSTTLQLLPQPLSVISAAALAINRRLRAEVLWLVSLQSIGSFYRYGFAEVQQKYLWAELVLAV